MKWNFECCARANDYLHDRAGRRSKRLSSTRHTDQYSFWPSAAKRRLHSKLIALRRPGNLLTRPGLREPLTNSARTILMAGTTAQLELGPRQSPKLQLIGTMPTSSQTDRVNS